MTVSEFLALREDERTSALLAAIAAWDPTSFLARARRGEDDARGPGYDYPDDNGLMWRDYQAERGR